MLVTELHLNVFLDKLIDLDKKKKKSIMYHVTDPQASKVSVIIYSEQETIWIWRNMIVVTLLNWLVRNTYLFYFFYTFIFLE